MTALSKLTLVAKTHTTNATPEAKLRIRLLNALDEQIAAAQALPGQYRPKRSRWIENKETGEKELKDVPVRFTPWWWTDENGKTFIGVRYANKWLEIKPKKTAVEIAALEALLPTLQTLRDAVLGGELDTVLKAASDARRAQFGGLKS